MFSSLATLVSLREIPAPLILAHSQFDCACSAQDFRPRFGAVCCVVQGSDGALASHDRTTGLNWRRIFFSQVPWPRPARMALFSVLAVALLVVGAIASLVAWGFFHHRYETPEAGFFSGSVHANVHYDSDTAGLFQFRGHSPHRWSWRHSTNIFYTKLEINWARFDGGNDNYEGRGELILPSMQYETTQGTGVLTRAVLAEWLAGSTNPPEKEMKGVEAIFYYLEAAGQGTLPAPRHHSHAMLPPLIGRLQHFSTGLGVPGLVFIWAGAWLCLVAWYGRRVWRVHTS
jgi:hypothetical protein